MRSSQEQFLNEPTTRKHRWRSVLLVVILLLLLGFNMWMTTSMMGQVQNISNQKSGLKELNGLIMDQDQLESTVSDVMLSPEMMDQAMASGSRLDQWINSKIDEHTLAAKNELSAPLVLNNATLVSNPAIAYTAGSGIVLDGARFESTLGSMIEGNEIAPRAIGFNHLNTVGCSNNDVLKFNGSAWGCQTDAVAGLSGTGGVTNRVALFSSSSNLGSSYLSQDANGLTIDGGKDLHLGGVAYGNGSGLFNLNGSQITPGTIGSSALQNGSVQASALADHSVTNAKLDQSSVTSDKIAAGAITLNTLGQSGCAVQQVVKWNGIAWGCASDDNSNTTYSAGGGVTLDSATNTISLDTSAANVWSGTHVFGSGFSVGGNTYHDLAGNGLQIAGGVLQSVLGTSIETDELSNSAVTNSKLANGSVSLEKLADNNCSALQTIAWNGSEWTCTNDANTAYNAGAGLKLVAGAFELDHAHPNTWTTTQTFADGLTLDGSTYHTLNGNGLLLNGGVLSAILGSSIESEEITDGAITANKLASGAVTLNTLGQSGCSSGEVVKWNGSAWTCATDSDNNAVYVAGTGLQEVGSVFSLDTNSVLTWVGTQTFNGGLSVGGNTYTNLAGTGLVFNGGSLESILGETIGTAELENGAVTNAKIADGTIDFSKLAGSSCLVDQGPKWDGTAWACADGATTPPTSTTPITYHAGNGLSLTNNTFTLDTTQAQNWTALQSFTGITLAGNTYTNLDGTGLTFSGGVLNSTLGTAIETAELVDGAVTNAKLAPAAITFDKLAQNNCTAQQILRWSGTGWTCGSDIDTDTTYAAGTGLSLLSGTFAIDSTQAHDWSGLHTFSGGISIGGHAYTNLAGAGLSFNNGTLSSTLGVMIDESELSNGAVTTSKLANGAVVADSLADASVTTAKLAQSGCLPGNTLKWQAGGWVCASDVDTDTDTTYLAGSGLALESDHSFRLNTAFSNTWTAAQAFNAGLTVGGNTYTELAGNGLSFNGGTLSVNLGTAIETNEIVDAAVTNNKLAGAISLDKLAGSGCAQHYILKWTGTAWVCALDVDLDTTYGVGVGLLLSSNVFSLDLTRPNTWSGLQSFNAGLSVNGTTYTNLAGNGLTLVNGALGSSLGVDIDSDEIVDGSILAVDLANNSVTSSKIVNSTILSEDLMDGAITSAKILDGTIAGVDIASGTITAANIADGTITASKVANSLRKRAVSVVVPSIASTLLSVLEQAVFVAPTNGTITKVSFTSGNTTTTLGTPGTLSLERKSTPVATAASLSLSSPLTALTPSTAGLGAGLNFNTGDIYSFKYTPGTGLTLSNLLITIEYTVND